MKPATVDEYIANFPSEQRAKLIEIRRVLRKVLPDVTEALKWGSPAMIHPDGMILLIYSGHKHHMNLVATPSAKEALADELTGYKTGKGSVQFSYDKPLPVGLIKKIAAHRLNEYRERGVKWM